MLTTSRIVTSKFDFWHRIGRVKIVKKYFLTCWPDILKAYQKSMVYQSIDQEHFCPFRPQANISYQANISSTTFETVKELQRHAQK